MIRGPVGHQLLQEGSRDVTQDWVLATTMPNAEVRVSKRLEKIDIPHFLFMRRFKAAHHGRLVEKLKPAFPSYIIVPMATCWNLAHHVSGVMSIVSFGSQPAVVRHDVVEGLVKICGGGTTLPLEEPERQFKYGDEVVVDGFLDVYGIYQNAIGEDRAVVLVEWLGRAVLVNVKESELRKRSSQPVSRAHDRRIRQRSRRASRVRTNLRYHTR